MTLAGPLRAEISSLAQAEDVQPELVPVACETEETDHIKRWLSAHGCNLHHPFGMPEPEMLSNTNGRRLALEDFCDGTLLCDLVARLQHRSKVGVLRLRHLFCPSLPAVLTWCLLLMTAEWRHSRC